MSLFKMAAGFEGKSQVVASDPLAAAVTVDTDELALFVPQALDSATKQIQVVNFVGAMLDVLRKAGTPTPATTKYTTVTGTWTGNVAPEHKDIVLALDATFAAPATADCELVMGELFQGLPGASVSAAVKRLLETWVEDYGKKAV